MAGVVLFGAVLGGVEPAVRGFVVVVDEPEPGLVSALVSVDVVDGFFGCVAGSEDVVVVVVEVFGLEPEEVDDPPRFVFVLELPPPFLPVCANVTVSVCDAEPLPFCAPTWIEFEPEFRFAVKLSV